MNNNNNDHENDIIYNKEDILNIGNNQERIQQL